MSSTAEPPDQEDFDQFFTVFDGSSPEDVSHARQLWSSLSLLPPLESRLVSADIRQRLPVSRPQRSSTAGPRQWAPEPPRVPAVRQRREERQRYADMADQRRETLALLGRQREQRVRRELVSVDFKPKMKSREKVLRAQEPADCETDPELVEQLQ
ncbi:cilia- and flagella-associated protein HOATZ [Dicentrarchus labrax]|uniref:Cilia- and flagella-associated protein HOATZ n=1 Tax=Dicentrarchus labrax TaxID=13489 RepID=A0A8P4GKW7_DICLA|nr:cilia- and flagella-associated protein HOATZ [Dicentrarchus labrax]